jgi:hypothetical protein
VSIETCDKICSGEIDLDECDEVEALRLQSVTQAEETTFYNSLGRMYFTPMPGKTKFQVAREYIDERLTFLQNQYYSEAVSPVKLDFDKDQEEVVNGFKLFSVKDNINMFTYSYFKELLDLMLTLDTIGSGDVEIDYEGWRSEMSNKCCSDWNKQDEHGNCYGGYWSAPEASEYKRDAWSLCFERSCKFMWNLPFSHAILLKTIDMGCGNRKESVRYSNFICVWIQRKIEAMNEAKKNLHNLIRDTFMKEEDADVENMTRIVLDYYDNFSEKLTKQNHESSEKLTKYSDKSEKQGEIKFPDAREKVYVAETVDYSKGEDSDEEEEKEEKENNDDDENLDCLPSNF